MTDSSPQNPGSTPRASRLPLVAASTKTPPSSHILSPSRLPFSPRGRHSTGSGSGFPLIRTVLIILLAFCTSSAIFYWRLHSNVMKPYMEELSTWADVSWMLSSESATTTPSATTDSTIPNPNGRGGWSDSGKNAAQSAIGNTQRDKSTTTTTTATRTAPDYAKLQKLYPNSTSPFAYAFVIGGCDPDYTPSYQNYLFNIAIAAKILQERGSTADVVALFQVSQKAQKTVIPYQDLRILHALGVYVYMIPQQLSGMESFYRTQLDKFRILGLTQYKRILFMDGDVMPVDNLDYVMELSYKGTLQENVVMRGVYEPANGGFFMLTPGHLPQLQEIVEWRERTAAEIPHPHYDPIEGWGHKLAEDDPWIADKESGTNWTFLAAFADQGLLYHYTKYARQNVSIMLKDSGNVENWSVNETDGTVQLLQVLEKPFEGFDSQRIQVPGRSNHDSPPMNSMVHFTGKSKPWLTGAPDDLSNESITNSPKHYWMWKLHELNQELNIGLNMSSHWSTGKQRPPLGLYPVYDHVLNASSNLLTPLERVYPATELDYRIIRTAIKTDP